MYRFSYIKNRFSYIKIFVFSILVVCIILLLVIPSCTVRQNYKDSTEYFYNYNNATSNNEIQSIEMKVGETENITLVVPQKKYFSFDGWYLDSTFNIKVSDEYGSFLIGDEIFKYSSTTLYAKWIVNEEITYRILMNFVTEVHATLETSNGRLVNVDYLMSDKERQVCNAIVYQFSLYLNEMFDGLVTFEIDSYFTKQPIYENCIYHGVASYYGKEIKYYYIDAQDIDEISQMTEEYRCVINTFSFNDYKGLLHHAGGYGNEKFAVLYLESILSQTILNQKPIESLLDLTDSDWDSILVSYAHEFVHTIEQGITVCEYHRVVAEYQSQRIPDSEATRLYLLNQAHRLYGTEIVGIPYSYWKGDLFTVKYVASEGGYIDSSWEDYWLGHTTQLVPRGSRTNKVIAYPLEGYEFVKWSDGEISASRTDYNIQKDILLYALFKKID